MKKATLKTDRLKLTKMTIAELNTEATSRILGGLEADQSTIVKASQASCMTMSDDCPGPQVFEVNHALL